MANILIAEDDRHTLEGLTEILTEEGYKVTGVSNGQQAFDLAQKKNFDLLLTDMKMPKLTGMDLIPKIKHVCPETKIIMMTAFSTVDTAVQAMRDGAFDYITKPIDFNQLLATIQSGLQEIRLKEDAAVSKKVSSIPEPQIVGQSEKIEEIFNKIDKVARANTKCR